MVKKLLLALAVVVGLGALAGATFMGLKSDPTGRAQAEGDKAALGRSLEAEFGGKAQVEFVCQYPMVGPAPCLGDNSMDSREVKVTLTGLPLAEDSTPEEQALAVARRAREASIFARGADTTQVIFQDDRATRSYRFTREDLTSDAAQAPDPGGQ